MWGMYSRLGSCMEEANFSFHWILIDMIMNNYKFSGTVPTLIWCICNMLALD
jgi:hypothetical protein